MGIGFRELLVILVIVVLVFGARRVPSIMGDLAKGIRSFKDGLKDEGDAAASVSENTKTGDTTKPENLPRDSRD